MKKILKITGISLLGIIVLIILAVTILPYFYKDEIQALIKDLANENLNATVEFSEVGVSVFKYFPAIMLYAKDVKIINSEQFDHTELLSAKTIALGVNFYGLTDKKLILDAIYLDSAELNFKIDSLGNANYNILKPSEEMDTDSTGVDFKIKKIVVKATNVVYDDKSTPLYFKLDDLNYKGTGDLSADFFDLQSEVKVKSFDFSVAHVDYVRNKSIDADIVTKIDAKELKFVFERNNIRIRNFPFSFNGHFTFIKGGYDFDLRMQSQNSTLEEMFSLVPPAYEEWKEGLSIKGDIDFGIIAKGRYMQDQSEKPSLAAKLKIDNGEISHKKINVPVRKIAIEAGAAITDLDIENLQFNIENLSFLFNGDQTKLKLESKGYKNPKLKGTFATKLELEKFQKTLGLTKHDIRGQIDLNIQADGVFKRSTKQINNKQVTVIASIPSFKLASSLKNGYIRYKDKDQAIKNINFDLNATAKGNQIRNITGKIENLNMEALDNYVRGNFTLNNLYPLNIHADLKSEFNLAEIDKFYKLDSLELKGLLDVHLRTRGELNLKNKKFPASHTIVNITDGSVKSLKYPDIPIENINLHTTVTSIKGTPQDLVVKLNPVAFEVANIPFKVEGRLENLDDFVYDLKTQGNLDLGKITKLFPIPDVEISGKINTNLMVKGSQKDLTNKNFENLKNGGQLVAENIEIRSSNFPEPFRMRQGIFKFFNDNMRLENIHATYGSSDLTLNGTIKNIIKFIHGKHYLRQKKQQFEAEFDLQSNHINADDFLKIMAVYTEKQYAEDSAETHNVVADTIRQYNPRAENYTGVILIPRRTNLKITTHIKQIEFSGYKIQKFDGLLEVKDRQMHVRNAGLQIAGTNVAMAGTYKPSHPRLAKYDATFKASNFDIQRAYNEIPIFQQMVSMAKDAYGIASLEYNLAGSIDENMDADFRSIAGEGTLTLEDIKFKNFKLLNQVAKKADAADLEKAAFNKIDIHSTIKDNVMTITPVTMKMSAFRGKLEGQVTMDGKLNIGFRLGLPPMGLINIPMKITGTADDFDISTGKYREDSTFTEESELNDIEAPERRKRHMKTETNNENDPEHPEPTERESQKEQPVIIPGETQQEIKDGPKE